MDTCWCGTFAAGLCVNCESPTCDDHSGLRRDGRWCSRCATREQDNDAARHEAALRKDELTAGDDWPILMAAAIRSQRPRHSSSGHFEHVEGWRARKPMPHTCRSNHEGCTLVDEVYRSRPSRQRTGRYEREGWTLAEIWTGCSSAGSSEGEGSFSEPSITEVLLTPSGIVFIGDREVAAASLTPDDVPTPQPSEPGLEWFKSRNQDPGPMTREDAVLAVHRALGDLADH